MTSKIIASTGFVFKENPTYIKAIATRIVEAISFMVKYLESNCATMITKIATTMPEMTATIFLAFDGPGSFCCGIPGSVNLAKRQLCKDKLILDHANKTIAKSFVKAAQYFSSLI